MESQILPKGLWKVLKRDAKCPFCGQPLTYKKTNSKRLMECQNPSCRLFTLFVIGVGVKFVFDTVMVSPLKAPNESGGDLQRSL
ncbi:MAG: hypothetical protein QXV01_12010 [Candidatus Bathyarchaeia archaeon]